MFGCVCVCVRGRTLTTSTIFSQKKLDVYFYQCKLTQRIHTYTQQKVFWEGEREIVLVLEMRNAFSQTYVFLFGGFWLVIFHVVGRSPFFFSLPFKVSRLIHTVVRTYTCVWVSKCVCRVYISITSIYNTSDCIRYIYTHVRYIWYICTYTLRATHSIHV